MKNVLTTMVPPGVPEKWYSRVRPCVHCRGQLIRRRETEAGVEIEVQHHPKCNAFGEVNPDAG